MSRYLVAVGMTICLASASASQSRAGEASELGFEDLGGKFGDIRTVGGQVFAIIKSGDENGSKRDDEYSYWAVEYGDDGTAFMVAYDRSAGNRYLSYDPTGKCKSVVLVSEGAGSLWKRTVKSGMVVKHVTLQAANGPLKGWYLDYPDEEVKIGVLVAHPLILSKEPRHIKEVIIGESDN
jgi:hypothetical protein